MFCFLGDETASHVVAAVWSSHVSNCFIVNLVIRLQGGASNPRWAGTLPSWKTLLNARGGLAAPLGRPPNMPKNICHQFKPLLRLSFRKWFDCSNRINILPLHVHFIKCKKNLYSIKMFPFLNCNINNVIWYNCWLPTWLRRIRKLKMTIIWSQHRELFLESHTQPSYLYNICADTLKLLTYYFEEFKKHQLLWICVYKS